MKRLFLMLPVTGQVVAAGDPKAGENLFKRCASCHQVGPYAHGGFGPRLQVTDLLSYMRTLK